MRVLPLRLALIPGIAEYLRVLIFWGRVIPNKIPMDQFLTDFDEIMTG